MTKINQDYKNIAEAYSLILENKFSKLKDLPTLNVIPAIKFQFSPVTGPLDNQNDYNGNALEDLLDPYYKIAAIGLQTINYKELNRGLFESDPEDPSWMEPIVKQSGYVDQGQPKDFKNFIEQLKKGKTLAYFITFYGSNSGYIFNLDKNKLINFLEQIKTSRQSETLPEMPINNFDPLKIED